MSNDWVKQQDINGNWGYYNYKTGQFRTTLPVQQSNTSVNQTKLTAQKSFTNRKRKMSDIAAERAVKERQQRQQYDAQYGKGTYNAKKTQERTAYQVAKAQEPDVVDNLLQAGQAVASGIGMAADMVSHIPVYSSLKAAQAGSEAINTGNPVKGVEAVLWGLPLAGGVYSQSIKPVVQTAAYNFSPMYRKWVINKQRGEDINAFKYWVANPLKHKYNKIQKWFNAEQRYRNLADRTSQQAKFFRDLEGNIKSQILTLPEEINNSQEKKALIYLLNKTKLIKQQTSIPYIVKVANIDKMTFPQFIKYLRKRRMFAEGTPQGETLVFGTSIPAKQFSIPIYGTDQVVTGSLPYPYKYPLTTFDFKTKKIINSPESGFLSSSAFTDLNKLKEATKSNLDYLTQHYPGFTPFGSSVGVAKGMPHVPHDFDGYMSAINFDKLRKSGVIKNTDIVKQLFDRDGKLAGYTIKLPKDYPGEFKYVDINLINADKNGFATGSRAKELYAQWFPEEYQAAVRAQQDGADFIIRRTPEELLAANHSTEKSIMDSFSADFTAFRKEKHAIRPYLYINYADNNTVANAIKQYTKSNFGIERIAPDYASLGAFKDPQQNAKLLDQIGWLGSPEVVNDPQRMQNILDYWALNQKMSIRGISDRNLPREALKGRKVSDVIDDAGRKWYINPHGETIGGDANGYGLNTGAGGSVNIYAPYFVNTFNIPKSGISYQSPLEYVTTLKQQMGIGNFSKEQEKIIKNILKRHGVNVPENQVIDSNYLLDNLNITSRFGLNRTEGKQFLQELKDEAGIEGLTRTNYLYDGVTPYRSMTGITDRAWNIYEPQKPLVERKKLVEKSLNVDPTHFMSIINESRPHNSVQGYAYLAGYNPAEALTSIYRRNMRGRTTRNIQPKDYFNRLVHAKYLKSKDKLEKKADLYYDRANELYDKVHQFRQLANRIGYKKEDLTMRSLFGSAMAFSASAPLALIYYDKKKKNKVEYLVKTFNIDENQAFRLLARGTKSYVYNKLNPAQQVQFRKWYFDEK